MAEYTGRVPHPLGGEDAPINYDFGQPPPRSASPTIVVIAVTAVLHDHGQVLCDCLDDERDPLDDPTLVDEAEIRRLAHERLVELAGGVTEGRP